MTTRNTYLVEVVADTERRLYTLEADSIEDARKRAVTKAKKTFPGLDWTDASSAQIPPGLSPSPNRNTR